MGVRAPARPELFTDHISTMSWVAAFPDDQSTETLARIDDIVMSGETPAEPGLCVVIGLASPAWRSGRAALGARAR